MNLFFSFKEVGLKILMENINHINHVHIYIEVSSYLFLE